MEVRRAVGPDRTRELVVAARAGDRAALADLTGGYLPLVYNVVGRAMAGHRDVDDVVQDTMLHAVRGLAGLRDPDRFRSWLISIAIRQVQHWGRVRGAAADRFIPLDLAPEPEDPGARFADASAARLDLSAQRREVAEATRLLGRDDRRVLALWWLEVDGSLSRADLASALGISAPHAGVRIQRMRSRLDLARTTLRAWRASPRCEQLTRAARGAGGGATGELWLRRLGRHVRTCQTCAAAAGRLVPAERLLHASAGLPIPAVVAANVAGFALNPGAAEPVVRGLGHLIPAKTAAAVTSMVVGAAAAMVFAVYYLPYPDPEPAIAAPPAVTVEPSGTRSPGAAATTPPRRRTAAPDAPAPVNGVTAADIFVAPDGDDDAAGSRDEPFATLGRAAAAVRPGQTIALRGGVYRPTTPVTITTSGTASARILLSAYRDERPVIDASAIRSNQWYVTQRASYWTVQGLEVRNAPTFPWVCESCRYNVYQRLHMHDNGATGLVLRDDDTVGNRVLDSDFHDNHDDPKFGENADGVAFKDGSGEGNLIRGCRGFRNADDGVDLSGFASPVTIEDTWVFGNGVNRWGLPSFAGGGAGFRLGGGDPVPAVAHRVTHSAAWDNAGYGFTEQNNLGNLQISNNTAFRNGKDGFAFWYSPATLSRNLSLDNARNDNRGELTHESGNSWDQSDWSVTDLRSTDASSAEGPRRADGSLPRTAFLTTARGGVGARMTP
jgi:pectate disaccharide-lyase